MVNLLFFLSLLYTFSYQLFLFPLKNISSFLISFISFMIYLQRSIIHIFLQTFKEIPFQRALGCSCKLQYQDYSRFRRFWECIMVWMQSPSMVNLLILLSALHNFDYQLFWFCVKYEQFSYFFYGLYMHYLQSSVIQKIPFQRALGFHSHF